MQFVNEYKNRGGRVTLGSDAGYIYKLYGFSYIQEMELLREAGFHPLEIFMSASLRGAEELGVAHELGTIEIGKLADIVLVDANPMANLKVLYGTGAIRVNEQNEPERIGGVRYTIKDGIIFDAQQLLRDVAGIVARKKAELDYSITQPGLEY
jgi:imidazolonepropionase-like amidohydrolase